MMRLALLREALAAARSQPISSALVALMVAGMCAASVLTTGRTVAAERAVLSELDAAGTRSIVVRADPKAGVTAGILDIIGAVAGVESAVGLGPVVDGRNAAIDGAPRVGIRHGFGTIGRTDLHIRHLPGTDDEVALASPLGLQAAGLPTGSGGLRTDDGVGVVVAGGIDVPPHLAFLEPLIVIPSSAPTSLGGQHPDEPITVLVVHARSPREVAATEAVLRSLLRPPEGATVTIETSAELAAVRAAVEGRLGATGRATVLGVVGVSGVLVALNLLSLVVLRRKDFGRRRALGARRSLIVALLLIQVTVLALAGAALGTLASLVWLASAHSPLPGPGFTAAVATAAVQAAMIGAILPALVAATRDPLRELRVP